MAAASSRTWRGAAQRASRSTSLRAQSAKFAVTGARAALIDVSLTWLLQIGFGLLSADPARAVGFITGTWAAYLLNRRWTFQAEATAVRFAGVLATYGVTFVVNMVAFAISQGTATVVNFAVQRWIIFRKAGVRVVAKQDPS
ncbi:GtrA family protein [Corynebacterium marquesiae]|uniref:GtrA family protein n=1 Tax=Corynebacterium marquesiae TaxID=2913503 RepID=UPI00254AF56C|nr:GtrA family protein [Corynebacterium marquesiae]MDK8481131.1 GtrA family protein [Corynebacterium marquesiae]MDU7599495.1 GtrA family protein [Corynebacterium sp.]